MFWANGASDVPVVTVTLSETEFFDLLLQESWQESRLPQSSLSQQREIRPPLFVLLLWGRETVFFCCFTASQFNISLEANTHNHQPLQRLTVAPECCTERQNKDSPAENQTRSVIFFAICGVFVCRLSSTQHLTVPNSQSSIRWLWQRLALTKILK